MSIPKRRLARLHRIRQLEEEVARAAVERAVAALRQAEVDVNQALGGERAARLRRNAALAGEEPGGWLQAESEAQMHRVLAVRRARTLPALEKETGASRDEYLERRRERQKLEKLLTKAAGEERMESERRVAAALEDLWRGRRWHESRDRK